MGLDVLREDWPYQHRHALFMAAWWSGRIVPWVCDPAKAEAARAEADAIALTHPGAADPVPA
jgi:hypothetical protein